jgi:CubicO group peptidase (beta-lactamase class C family)
MRAFNRGLVFIAAAALLTAATAMPRAARSEQAAVAVKAYYPAAGNDTWEKKRPEDVGMDPKALAAAIELAKASDNKQEFSLNPREYIERRTAEEGSGELLGPFRDRTTINGVVLRHGYIVAEFGDTLKPDMTFSVAKSFVSTTVGLAFDAGLIKDVNDPVGQYVKDGGYDSSHNAPITWQQSLQQTSEWEGTLWGKHDTADRRRGKDRKLEKPGTFYEYNDVRVNRVALNSLLVWRRPLPDVLREKVMAPIGASSTWEWHGYRNSDVVIDGKTIKSVSGGGHWGGGVWITSRDLARVGYLFLRKGKWGDRQLISERWIKLATTPGEVNPQYGYMWWLNTGQKQWPGVPESAFAMLGAGSNICFVDPDHDLVVVLRWVDRRSRDILLGIVQSVKSGATIAAMADTRRGTPAPEE